MIRDEDVHGAIRRMKKAESAIRELLEPIDDIRLIVELTALSGQIAYLEGLSGYTAEKEITYV